MQNKVYKISIQLDYVEMKAFRRALNLLKTTSAIMDYAENIETCEIIENKLEQCM